MKAASDVLKFMDASVNPCDDFYNFACGKFLTDTTLSDEKVSVDTFSIARDTMQSQLLRLIDSPVADTDLRSVLFFLSFFIPSPANEVLTFHIEFQIISIGQTSVQFVHESKSHRRDWNDSDVRHPFVTRWLAMCCWR